jgi:hypothetical protein
VSGARQGTPEGVRYTRAPYVVVVAAIFLAAIPMWSTRTDAHKPITSPFTFSDDVLPIVKERCAECHSPGGIAPMSLLTHADTIPWAESIRVELMAGHMPPWRVESAATRFRNLAPFTARELNVLLTWASGGTPQGAPDPETVSTSRAEWTLGTPDLTIPLRPVTIGGDVQARAEEFHVTIPVRSLRAVDLLPGTPSVVRRATISVRPRYGAAQPAGISPERLVGLWLPGDHAVALDPGMGFQVPELAELIVRIDYRKTWQYERESLSDQSTIGLYFADAAATDVQVLRALAPVTADSPATFATTINEDVRAIALYADPELSGAQVRVVAARPDGSTEELIAFRPRAEWTRRYFFREPITLPKGTRVQVRAAFDGDALLPPAAPRPMAPPGPRSLSLALNVVRARQ